MFLPVVALLLLAVLEDANLKTKFWLFATVSGTRENRKVKTAAERSFNDCESSWEGRTLVARAINSSFLGRFWC